MGFDYSFLYRKKQYDATSVQQTNLHRVLKLSDITAIGISNTLGNGIYILTAIVIANFTGPGVVLTFLVAGLVTCLAGMCYAEFGARLPRSGSAYVYIYVAIGEFVAFILGWDIILEYVIGTSANASSLSFYINSLVNNRLNVWLVSLFGFTPATPENLGSYVDLTAFIFVILITLVMVVGVKESCFMNKIFTVVNLTATFCIIGLGLPAINFNFWDIKSPTQVANWTDDSTNVTYSCTAPGRFGSGGFLPFGVQGIIAGTAKCFYAYIGFDAICSTGEEVENAKKNIPLSIIISLLVTSVIFCSCAFVLTLMIPYCMINPDIGLVQAFDYNNLNWAKYVASGGAIASLLSNLYSGFFPMPRVIYSLASDGLIFKFFSAVLPNFKTPYAATLVSGLFAAAMVLLFNLNSLIDMMSIGTLMAYSTVALCVLVLRYRPNDATGLVPSNEYDDRIEDFWANFFDAENLFNFDRKFYYQHGFLKSLFSCSKSGNKCTVFTARLVNTLTFTCAFLLIMIAVLINLIVETSDVTCLVFVCIAIIVTTFVLTISFFIYKQPQDDTCDAFQIPFMPFSALGCFFINVFLMMTLSIFTWIRFFVWFVVGMIIYWTYGKEHSLLNNTQEEVKPITENETPEHKISETEFY